MYCENCGKEVQEDWKQCPYCSHALKRVAQEFVEEEDNTRFNSRSDLKKYLTERAWGVEKRSVVAWYGSYAISGDLIKVLTSGEIPKAFFDIYEKTIFRFIKRLRFFRTYIVCTNQRILYYETGCQFLKLFPFLRKCKTISYRDIKEIQVKEKLGIYSGEICIETESKTYRFIVNSKKSAEILKDLIKSA